MTLLAPKPRILYAAVPSVELPSGPLEVVNTQDHTTDGWQHVVHLVHTAGSDVYTWISAGDLTSTPPSDLRTATWSHVSDLNPTWSRVGDLVAGDSGCGADGQR